MIMEDFTTLTLCFSGNSEKTRPQVLILDDLKV